MPVLGVGDIATSGIARQGVSVPAGWGASWRTRRALSASQWVDVVCLGDSTTQGVITAGGGYPITAKYRSEAVRLGYTDGGRGVGQMSDTAAFSGENLSSFVSATGFAGDASMVGFMGDVSPKSTTAGDTITFQGTGTALRIHYLKTTATGTFSYAVDGGSATTINAADTQNRYGNVLVTGLTAGTHTVTVTNVSGGTVYLAGVDFLNSTGIVFHKHAVSGKRAQDFLNPGNSSWMGMAAAFGLDPTAYGATTARTPKPSSSTYRQPALAIINFGINDYISLQSIDTFTNSIQGMCTFARSAGADVLGILPTYYVGGVGATFYGWGIWKQRFASVLRANGCAIVDSEAALGGANAAIAAGYAVENDVHLTQSGYQKLGQFVCDNVLFAN